MAISLEDLQNQPFVQAHKNLYKVALERMAYSEVNSDRAFWDELDPEVRDKVKKQMKEHGDKPVWRML
jgi:hypothetical protein